MEYVYVHDQDEHYYDEQNFQLPFLSDDITFLRHTLDFHRLFQEIELERYFVLLATLANSGQLIQYVIVERWVQLTLTMG